ncbi:hypothetical protein FACS18942_04230 [Planctomycetales bacterium]|nr:hypothetical protein FACS18942_04230 [Planctomycetales bacterium]
MLCCGLYNNCPNNPPPKKTLPNNSQRRSFLLYGLFGSGLLAAAVFDFPNCLLYEDTECTICERECPYEAIEYIWSEKEYRKIVVIDKAKCTGCGKCIATCPVCIKNITLIKAQDPPLWIAPLETSS